MELGGVRTEDRKIELKFWLYPLPTLSEQAESLHLPESQFTLQENENNCAHFL